VWSAAHRRRQRIGGVTADALTPPMRCRQHADAVA